MRDLRPNASGRTEKASDRSKILGAAVVIVGLGALGAYAFASARAPKAEPQKPVSTFVRTTPEYSEIMPPPVSPTPRRTARKSATPQQDLQPSGQP